MNLMIIIINILFHNIFDVTLSFRWMALIFFCKRSISLSITSFHFDSINFKIKGSVQICHLWKELNELPLQATIYLPHCFKISFIKVANKEFDIFCLKR